VGAAGEPGAHQEPGGAASDVDVDRTTASVIYEAGNTQTTFAWGRNAPTHGKATDVLLLESAARLTPSHTVFARAEQAEKNELFAEGDPRAEEIFRVAKLSLGYVYDLPRDGHYKIGFGGLVSRYRIPAELRDVYGNPTSFMVFARVRIR